MGHQQWKCKCLICMSLVRTLGVTSLNIFFKKSRNFTLQHYTFSATGKDKFKVTVRVKGQTERIYLNLIFACDAWYLHLGHYCQNSGLYFIYLFISESLTFFYPHVARCWILLCRSNTNLLRILHVVLGKTLICINL